MQESGLLVLTLSFQVLMHDFVYLRFILWAANLFWGDVWWKRIGVRAWMGSEEIWRVTFEGNSDGDSSSSITIIIIMLEDAIWQS